MPTETKLARFHQNVLSKFQIYNSIFMTLPFDAITKTGALLPLFHETCVTGYNNGDDPSTIIQSFFQKYLLDMPPENRIDLLFRFIQYIERQVVLFDAIEDAAFPIINNMDGIGTLRHLKDNAMAEDKLPQLINYLNEFRVRIVLTAHPTQFYPGSVLGIITDLTESIKENDLNRIQNLMAQLGKTPFFKKKKPTPFDEAVSLIWYLEHVFYYSFGSIIDYIKHNIYDAIEMPNEIINIGFWPGGDRDGNPFVTPEITLKVALKLKQAILRNYYKDIKKLKRKLTFVEVENHIVFLERKLYEATISPNSKNAITLVEFTNILGDIRGLLINKHQSLYLNEVDSLINKTKLFGFKFASLDIRQDSRKHNEVFQDIIHVLKQKKSKLLPANFSELNTKKQLKILSEAKGKIPVEWFKNEFTVKTLQTIVALKQIQESNGEQAANRYIISNNQTAINVIQLFAMLKLFAFKDDLSIDIVPLFETVPDLENAAKVMEELYTNPAYVKHLKKRKNKQTIMLGFSDGTKDGGYLMANWAIYRAKEELTKISRKFHISVIFFDGRGGPPARGGGKTHNFYASLGPSIEDKEVQLTIQGQTISSNFGTIDSSQFNMEQLISSGILNRLNNNNLKLSRSDRNTMKKLAELSYEAYTKFKEHDKFLSYLEHMSTLKYYAKTNIGSRPSKRGGSDKLVFSDLRAIPFVGSWSQLKQNVPGFFGVGTAMKYYEDKGEFRKVKNLYRNSSFFRTLIENSMMSLSKSFFDLTKYMSDHEEYGEFWKLIYEEYKLSKRLILKLTGYKELMQEELVGKESIAIRESIVLPLLTIQQYALKQIDNLESEKANSNLLKVYENLVMRSLFGNINASRNSA